MTGRVLAIVLNTFREAVRHKVVYGVLFLVVAINFAAVACGEMSLAEEARVARDFGLAGMSLFGSVTAIVLGVLLLYNEIQKRTVHVILAKPIHRFEFVLGKYLGMAVTLSLLCVAFAAALGVMLASQGLGFDQNIVKATVLAWLEVMVVAAIAIFFSSFSTPYLSGIFSFGLFAIGRSYAELTYAAEKWQEPILRAVAEVALWLVPDLHLYVISGGQVDGQHVSVHATFVPWAYVGHAALHAAAWTTALLLLAIAIFSRRDFV
jgi:ABC-type transport system involved in multi-copper enzyme maturation permease subunit